MLNTCRTALMSAFVVSIAATTAVASAQGAPDFLWLRGGHAGGGASPTWSPDGAFFATGGDDFTIKIWQSSDGQLVRTMYGHGGGFGPAVEWSPDGQHLVSYSWDSTLRLWDASDGTELWSLNAGTELNTAAFSPDGSMIASGGFDNIVTIRDTLTGKVITTLTGHTDYISDVVFSPDGERIASIAQDRRIRIYDTSDWSFERLIPNTHDFFAVSVEFSPDSQVLGSAGGLDTPAIKLWNPDTGSLIETLSMGGGSGPATGIDFSADGTMVAAGRNTGARIFSLTDYTQLQHAIAAGSVRFSPDSQTFLGILYAPGDPYAVAEFNVEDGSIANQFMSHTSPATAVAVSPDGSLVASAAIFFDSSIQVWDAATGQRTHSFAYTINSDGLTSVDFSPDGQLIAGGGGDWDHSTRVWRISDGKLLYTLPQGPNYVPGLDFSPDGTTIATGSDTGSLVFWTTAGGIPIDFVNVGSVEDLMYAPDGQRVAVALGNGTIRFVDPLSVEIVDTIAAAHSGAVFALDYADDGSVLVSGGSDGLIKIWNTAEMSVIDTLVGHTGAVTGVDLSTNGELIVSGSSDATIRLWDATTGELMQTYDEETGIPGDGVTDVVFTPDGQQFAYTRADGSVIFAAVPVETPAADLNADGQVNGQDLLTLLNAWGQPGETDLNQNGTTGGGDLLILLNNWG